MSSHMNQIKIDIPEPVADLTDPIVQLLNAVASDRQGQVGAADRLEHLLRERKLL